MLLNIDGEITLLELQNINRHNFKERILFYSSSIMITHGLKSGEDYRNLKNIKVCAIINYKGFNNDIKDIIKLKRKNRIFIEKLEFQIFDLTKVDINDKTKKCYELVNLFKNNNLDELTEIIKDKTNEEILEQIKYYNLDSEERVKMENIIDFFEPEEEHYENAYINGFEIGNKQGKREGISQGKNQEKIDIAKNLISKNVDIDFIVDVTGLSKEQINVLI